MDRKDAIVSALGGDQRMEWAVKTLRSNGMTVHNGLCIGMTHLLLPMPAVSPEGRINGGPPLDVLRGAVGPGVTVLGGKMGTIGAELAAAGATVMDYYLDEQLTAANAAITAEGAIQLAMGLLPITLLGARCLVTGWGRIAQLISLRLMALGADVSVAARKAHDLGMICAMGIKPVRVGDYNDLPVPVDVIFNTVPAQIFTEEQVRSIAPNGIWMELASAPGGFPESVQSGVTHAGGLPGKTAPKSAGILIGRTVLRLCGFQ